MNMHAGNNKTKTRVYVCHTYYHVYVSILKEMKLERESKEGEYKKADIVLSTLSTDFEMLDSRLRRSGIFNEVITMVEKRDVTFQELDKYRANYDNILKHLVNRIIYTKRLAKLESPYMNPIGFEKYEDVYVYCDSDPIGYYLNYKHIYYHAVEDGLDTLKNSDDAYISNFGHFKFKAWCSRHNIIFIMNGWGKYCLDMEVNDISVVPGECPRLIEVPRKPMENALTPRQKELMLKVFIEDYDALKSQLISKNSNEEFAMYLSEGYPNEEDIRKKICLDIIEKYCKGYKVIIKPHPMDKIDYEALCPEAIVLRGRFPIEVLNFIEGLHIKKAVAVVSTAMANMDFVEEKLNLGVSFWDAYEDPQKHGFNKSIGFKMADK
jgi:hypothetical protein